MSSASKLVLIAAFLFTQAGASAAADGVNVSADVLEQFRRSPPPISATARAHSTPSVDGTKYSVIAPVSSGTDGNLSFVRLSNFQGVPGATDSKTTTFAITVVGSPSGNVYGTTSIQVPPLASPQYALSDILSRANAGPLAGGDTGYALYLQNPDTSGYQHVVYNANNGFFEDDSVCNNGGYENSKGPPAQILTNVHTSVLASYPSDIVIHNFGAATTYKVTVVDAKTGTVIGAVNLDTAANAYYGMPETFFEQQLKWTPSSNQQHINLIFQDVNNSQVANAVAEQFIFNQALSAYINMSVGCTPPQSSGTSSNYTLTLTSSGTGTGTITTAPSGISCVGNCNGATAQFAPGTVVTLTATPNTGSSLQSWGGACSGTGTCTVTMNSDQNVTATFAGTFLLTVNAIHSGSATGTVTSSPAGISLCATCAGAVKGFSAGTAVTLTATPSTGATFLGWSGACSGTGTCTVTMSAASSVTASFGSGSSNTYALNLSLANTAGGSGTIVSSPSGISCSQCTSATASFTAGTSVTLTATPTSGSTFTGWGGACSGTGTCTVTMNAAQNVTAAFAGSSATNYTLNLTSTYANGSNGSVVSVPAGISCIGPATTGCTTNAATFSPGTSVTLTATPASGSSFQGWGGACSGTGACTVTMNANQSVTAAFGTGTPPVNYTLNLSVTNAGGSSGTVTSSPSGISCGGTCTTASSSFGAGTRVVLTATPASGSTFLGWTGPCSGTGTCAVAMSANQSVTAAFGTVTSTYTLNLAVTDMAGGSGTVVSSPAGIGCGGTCSAASSSFNSGTSVQLTATPAAGSTFQGWGVDCSAAGSNSSCTIIMNAIRNVSATFAPTTYPLTITVIALNGGAGGTMGSSPPGIRCGVEQPITPCASPLSAQFAVGTFVNLDANGIGFASFLGWGGACSGTGHCQMTMNSAQNVTATFGFLRPLALTIVNTAGGSGTISSSPAGINDSCSASQCSEVPDTIAGTTFTLTATPGPGSTFTGWQGVCAGRGTGVCSITLSGSGQQAVVATFAGPG